MTSDQYRAAISALGLSQAGAGVALEISERTSRRYAMKGVPTYAVQRITNRLVRLANKPKETET